MTTAILPTRNPAWGFWGSIGGHADQGEPQAERDAEPLVHREPERVFAHAVVPGSCDPPAVYRYGAIAVGVLRPVPPATARSGPAQARRLKRPTNLRSMRSFQRQTQAPSITS